jgi:hypothetical protein
MRVEHAGDIQHEKDIVWVDEKAKELPYLRENLHQCHFRRRKPGNLHRKIVAYAVLSENAPKTSRPYYFERRIWYLASHDPYNGGGGPIEAVDPTSIKPRGISSDMSPDQWNRTGDYERFK